MSRRRRELRKERNWLQIKAGDLDNDVAVQKLWKKKIKTIKIKK